MVQLDQTPLVVIDNMSALCNVLQVMKDTIDAPSPGEDRRCLVRAVSRADIRSLRELKDSGKVTNTDILRAAIDEDEVTILEEFNDQHVYDQELLDYSISREAVKTSRKISASMVDLRDRAVPLLKIAIVKENVDFVSHLLDRRADLSLLSTTPLHLAVLRTSTSLVRNLCLRNPSWLTSWDCQGLAPIHITAKEGGTEMCRLLLELGANADTKDSEGRTALHWCVESGREGTIGCMEVLFGHNSNVDEKNNKGETPLLVAANCEKLGPYACRRKALVKLLLTHHAHMNIKSGKGESALELIAKKVPSAIDEVMKRLDTGIRIDDPENETKIQLDFRKVFSVTEGDQTGNIMAIFINLANTPFKGIVNHPLVKAFLALKMQQVRYFYSALIFCHLIFSVVFSVYCILLYSNLCPPQAHTKEQRKFPFSTITCKLDSNQMTKIHFVNFSWVFLIIFIPVYICRESLKLFANVRARFFRAETFLLALMFVLLLLMTLLVYPAGLLPKPLPEGVAKYEFCRWKYYVASVCCCLLWIEMMVLIGRVPMFGKYVQMYR